MKFAQEWAIAVAAVGHPLGSLTSQTNSEGVNAAVQEFDRYWMSSERTTWRRLNTFREVFPEYESPAEFAEVLGPAAEKLAAAMNDFDATLVRRRAGQGQSPNVSGAITT
jgi:hypothetical protein